MINDKLKYQDYFAIGMFIAPVFVDMIVMQGHLAIISLFFVLVYFYYLGRRDFRKISFSFPLNIWLVLTLYHSINAFVKNVPEVDAIDLLHGLRIYACIAITAYWFSLDKEKTVYLLLNCFLIRCLVSIGEFLIIGQDNGMGRMVTSSGSSTAIGQLAAITIVLLMFLNNIKKVSWIRNVFYISIPLVIIVLTQTRNCLAMAFFALLTIVFLKSRMKSRSFVASNVLVLIIGAILVYSTINLFSDSAFAHRIAEKSNEEGYYYQIYSTGTLFDTIVGDRLIYYVQGFQFFLSSPYTGIGMWMYEPLSRGNYPLHTEYMVHLCEGGLIAITLWCIFIYTVFIRIYKSNSPFKIAAFSAVFINLFCAIYAREFFYDIFYPTYGFALSLGYNKLYNNRHISSFNGIVRKYK